MLDNGIFRMTRGDRQRLPSWDETEYLTLDTLDDTEKDEVNVPDLTNRTVDLALVTKLRGGDRIALSNAVEIGDPTAGEVAITLEESDTAIPIDGIKTNLYGEFRISGGTEDPTTAGVIKIELRPSSHDVEGEAQLLPYGGLQNPATADLDMAGHGITNAGPIDTEHLPGVADWIVKDKDTLQTLFPPLAGDSTPLEAGDTVIIAPDDGPIRYDGDLWINSIPGISIYGQYHYGASFELMPADETEARGFCINNNDDSIVRIEGLSFNGNKDNQTHGSAMGFIFCFSGILHAHHNYARDLYPFQEHSGGGDLINSPQSNRAQAVYASHNISDTVGDRTFTINNCDEVRLWNNRAKNGFDRMASMRGVSEGYIIGNHFEGSSDGSAFGIGSTAAPADGANIVVRDNYATGEMRGFLRITTAADGGNENIQVLNNTAIKTASDDPRPAIEIQSPAGEHVIRGNHFEGFENGGVHIRGSNVQIDGNKWVDILASPASSMIDVGDGLYSFFGGTDTNIGDEVYVNPPTLASGLANTTRPRKNGVIGGGFFGGVDLTTVMGQVDGDEAMSDGTAVDFPEFARAVWDETNGQWVRLDGQATVTPV